MLIVILLLVIPPQLRLMVEHASTGGVVGGSVVGGGVVGGGVVGGGVVGGGVVGGGVVTVTTTGFLVLATVG